MTTSLYRRWLATAWTFCLLPLLVIGADAPPAVKTFDGKVVTLAGILEKQGAKLDRDAAGVSLALATNDGKTYPLIKDDGSRMFFLDPTLLNRPMRLTGKLLADGKLLQVTQIQSLVKDELHDIYYWCDICAIKRFEKKECECCGAPMELREVKVKK